MPTTQTLLWTALPNGLGPAGEVRLSVFVSVRLRSDEGTTLAVYPDFLNWAERMQPDQVKFTLEVDNGVSVDAALVSAAPDIDLWKALFVDTIPVRPYVFDNYTSRPIVTMPAGALLGYIKGIYQQLAAASPTELPLINPPEGDDQRRDVLGRLFGDLVRMQANLQGDRLDSSEAGLSRRLGDALEGARQHAAGQRAANPLGGPLVQPDGMFNPHADAFYRAMLFHYRPENAAPVDIPKDDAARARFQEEFDFHQMLAALADYPQLLRRLGLVFDLTVPADALPQTPDEWSMRKVRVVPAWNSEFPRRAAGGPATWTADVSPRTVYLYATVNGYTVFAPVSQGGQSVAGVWTPGKSVSLQQVDVDGAALKTLNLASSLARAGSPLQQQSLDAPAKAGAPTLRTGGIAVVRTGHAAHLNDGFNRAAALNKLVETDPPPATDLYAEDLLRGYRVDVYEQRTGQWRSLHARTGTYTAAGVALPPLDDEGFTQLSVTGPAHAPGDAPKPEEEIYAHESLFTWDGWSLSAPRPGLPIVTPRGPGQPDGVPARVANTAMTRLGLETAFKVQPGTLPRLRFGQGYALRVRVTDLAGNSPTLDEVERLRAALPHPDVLLLGGDDLIYCRFEPVSAPELAPRQIYSPSGDPDGADAGAFGEGESLDRLVIRSNYDRSAGEYAADLPNYQPFNERHVAAPKASQTLVERHGMLDPAFDARSLGLDDAEVKKRVDEAYQLLAAREGGSLNAPGLPTVRVFRTGGAAGEEAGYAVHTEEQLILPYLPDPWAAGVVFQGLPGMAPGDRLEIPFGGATWDEAPPFRLRLAEGEAAPEWDAAARVLTVRLPKAGIATARASSAFGGDLEAMGLWQWLREGLGQGLISAAEMEAAERAAREGRHWMFTPWRELTLVHAVQQPLIVPDPELVVARGEGATAAQIHGLIRLHAPSTSKIDITADWTEPLDDPADPAGPRRLTPHAHVMELPVTLDRGEVLVNAGEGRDALRVEDAERLIFNTLHAQWASEYLQTRLGNPPPGTGETERRGWHDQLNLAAKVAAHEFGDTKYRHVRYTVAATTRFREYFAPTLTAVPDNLQRAAEAQEFDVPSTARPAVPRILHILPAFAWDAAVDEGGAVTSRRAGGALRIYLDRGWWSSGDGEMLAVVLTSAFPLPADALYRFSTFWGQDPLWRSPGLPLPRPEDFLNSGPAVTQVLLPGTQATRVTVMPHEVQWDDARKLWYCDVQLNTGAAYFPFVRLALARFQPHGLLIRNAPDQLPVTDLRLGPVVAADFAQTVPDRALTVTRDVADPGLLRISVSGVTYTAQRGLNNAEIAATSSVEALLQAADPALLDDAVAWRDVAAAVPLAAGAPDAAGVVVWSGQIKIPADAPAGRLRVAVQEYETLPVALPAGQPAASGRRIVYVDTVAL